MVAFGCAAASDVVAVVAVVDDVTDDVAAVASG